MVVKVRCPNPGCGQHYSVPDEQLGHTAVCKKCKQPFTVVLPAKRPPPRCSNRIP